ncbi:hypothetical protein [Microbacterium sp. nov. GSS16]|uniref:hypothetical protein n=1 Tax=Microbacterium sp. nov. GSS16 TaxID=3019890 RepID=UPI0023059DC6|nr:hypothetical protein [Microbacterium sp. nov. GSS16]WCD91896.1 hypothetical protein PGB26_09405 [Microbacterium sp. nov. GSS16]
MRAVRRAVLPTVIGAIGAGVLHVLGVQSIFAWGWAIAAATVTLLTGIRMPDDPRFDAPGRPPDPRYVGSEISRLAWAINPQTDTANEAVTRRVRATLRRRLGRLGVDTEDDAHSAAVDRHLGPGLWQRLNGRRTTVRDIRDGLDAAERLEQLAAPLPQQIVQPSLADQPRQGERTG